MSEKEQLPEALVLRPVFTCGRVDDEQACERLAEAVRMRGGKAATTFYYGLSKVVVGGSLEAIGWALTWRGGSYPWRVGKAYTCERRLLAKEAK